MILVTGGAGFIGGNYLHYLVEQTSEEIVCVDLLTPASNYNFIKPLVDSGRVKFVCIDIGSKYMRSVFHDYKPDYIINFAAESHVDNSINDFSPFIETNILGTINLLTLARDLLPNLKKFIHISTDEVYGSLELNGDEFTELSPYQPNNPYSASKASSDHFVRAFHKTYGLPTIITNCSNNYGPGQHTEKFIPTVITKAIKGEDIPVYGDGRNVRDWLYVEDHCRAIQLVLEKGVIGEKYNIGGGTELSNTEVAELILRYFNMSPDMIQYVKDRPGHDRRYAISCIKISHELGYIPKYNFIEGLKKTIEWYTNDNKRHY
jgi:dTDP-glucose 4,6-dehydratase